VEQPRALDLGDAGPAVLHAETQARFIAACAQDHLAALGELQRVVDQVEQNLSNAHRIADHARGQILGQRHAQTDALGLREAGFQLHDFVHQLTRVERHHFQFKSPGFDARQIE